VSAAVFRPADTLRPERGQAFVVEVEVDQGEVGAQPIMVLGNAPVSHPCRSRRHASGCGTHALCYHLGPFRYTSSLPPGKGLSCGSMLLTHELLTNRPQSARNPANHALLVLVSRMPHRVQGDLRLLGQDPSNGQRVRTNVRVSAELASRTFQSIAVGHRFEFHANGVGDGDDRASFECESRQH
jgi:hypothetical protein